LVIDFFFNSNYPSLRDGLQAKQSEQVTRQKSADSPLLSKHHKSQISLEQSNSVRLNKIPSELTEESSDNVSQTDVPEVTRSLIRQSHVLLLNVKADPICYDELSMKMRSQKKGSLFCIKSWPCLSRPIKLSYS